MEVSELQKLIMEHVGKWAVKRGVAPTKDEVFIHLVEEVGELAQQYVSEKQRKDQYSFAEVENAIGDILTQLVYLADMHGLNIEDVIVKIIKEEAPRLES